MSGNHKIIQHDGGSVGVSAEVINKDKACLIRFGSSFTLRVNEANLDKLRDLLNDSKLIFNQIKSQTERQNIMHMQLSEKQTKALVELFGELLTKAEDDRLKQGAYVEKYLGSEKGNPIAIWHGASHISSYARQVKDWGLACSKECTLARVLDYLKGELEIWNDLERLKDPSLTLQKLYVNLLSVADVDRNNLDNSFNYWIRDIMMDVGRCLDIRN